MVGRFRSCQINVLRVLSLQHFSGFCSFKRKNARPTLRASLSDTFLVNQCLDFAPSHVTMLLDTAGRHAPRHYVQSKVHIVLRCPLKH